MSEQSDVTSPLLKALLKLPGVWAMRVHSGSARGGKQHLAPVGTPDVLAVVRGIPLFFECKAPSEKLSKKQGEQIRRICLAGGEVYAVHAVTTALAIIQMKLNRKA